MKRCLVDVNVMLAATHSIHADHAVARQWLDRKRDGEVGVCRAVQMSLLRLLTNVHVMGPAVMTTTQAWKALDEIAADGRAVYQPEPDGMLSIMRSWTEGKHLSGSAWTDAYLAAFAHQAGLEVATMDRGMRRFPVEVELVG